LPERISARPLLDKLGVRYGARVSILGVDDAAFLESVRERTADVTEGSVMPGSDLVLLAADSVFDLTILPDIEPQVRRDGAIWVVSRKGRAASLRDVDVIAAAKAAGLVDNKVVSFSATHTSLRLVVPLARR
jgi:hypothetical protein